MIFLSSAFVTAAIAVSSLDLVGAHPIPKRATLAVSKRQEFHTYARRGLSSCQDQLRKRGGVYDRARLRRESFAEKARRDLGISMGMCVALYSQARLTNVFFSSLRYIQT